MKKCKLCQKVFEPPHNSSRYCSKSCNIEEGYYRTMKTNKELWDWRREHPEEIKILYEKARKRLMEEKEK